MSKFNIYEVIEPRGGIRVNQIDTAGPICMQSAGEYIWFSVIVSDYLLVLKNIPISLNLYR